MINREDQITVLTRMVIPLYELADKNSVKISLRIYDSNLEIQIWDEENEACIYNVTHFYDEDKDWDVGERMVIRFRTFESTKEILWAIREALS